MKRARLDDSQTLGTAMTVIRTMRSFPRAVAARRSGLSATTLWRIETGETSPDVRSLMALAKVYGASFTITDTGVAISLTRKA